MKSWPKIVLLVLLYSLAGFTREYLFESINIKLYYLWNNEQDSILEESLAFLNQYSYWTLYWLKWILTSLFTGLYLGLGLLAIRLFFKPSYNRLVLFAYALIIGISVVLFSIGYLINEVHSNYAITRDLMDWLQSPVIMLFLVPAIMVHERSKENTTKSER